MRLRTVSPRLAAPALGLALTLTACGGGSSGSQVASLNDGGATDGTTTESTTAADTQQQWLEFAQCMRDNGVDMEDPTFDANGNLQGGFGPDSGIDPRDETTQAAMQACQDVMPAGGPGSGDGPDFDVTAIQDAMNNFTSCLRDQGLDVDDIDFSAGPGGGPGGDGGTPPTGDAAQPPTSDGGGFQGGPPPSDGTGGPGGAGGDGFDPTARILEQLGLDSTDATVSAAVDACSSNLDGAFPTPGGDGTATTTTVSG